MIEKRRSESFIEQGVFIFMAYEKKVAVLKQVGKGFSADGSALSGAVHLERFGAKLSVKVQSAGIAALKEGRYALVIKIGNETFCRALDENERTVIENAPSIKEGFGVLLAFVKDEAQPVAFGRCGASAANVDELLRALTSVEKKGEKIPAVPRIPVPPPPSIPPASPNGPTIPMPQNVPKEALEDRACFREGACAYDDEAIAENDYFYDRVQESDRDENVASKGKSKGRKAAGGDHFEKDENVIRPFLNAKGKLTYYKKVREELNRAFEKFPKDMRLMKTFPRSEWVKTENALLGVIYKDGRAQYLCVAVEKKGDPPEEMKERCCFVPESPFSDEEGFYIVFQDADTGAYVTMNPS